MNSSIAVYPMYPIPNFMKTRNTRLFFFLGPLKVLFQAWNLWLVLGYKTRPAKWMLIQVSPNVKSWENLFLAVRCVPDEYTNTSQSLPLV